MKLYEISNDYQGLLALAEDGELTQEAIADTLEALDTGFVGKVRNCVMVLKEIEAGAAAAKTEMERMKSLADSRQKQADRMKEYISENMKYIGKDKLDLGIFSLTLKKPTKVADIDDESKIPKGYWVEVPATERLDKKALLDALKAGPVEGARLKDGKRALLIK